MPVSAERRRRAQHQRRHRQEQCRPVDDLLAQRAHGLSSPHRGVELVLQALIDAEATEVIGAQPYERTPARANQCVAHPPNTITASSERLLPPVADPPETVVR